MFHSAEIAATHLGWEERKQAENDLWPNGARLAVLVYTAPEEWEWSHHENLPPAGAFAPRNEPVPSLSTRSGVEYGFRIGLERMREIFSSFGMRVTLWTTANAATRHAGILRSMLSDGHEIGAHGASEGMPLSTLDVAAQREAIDLTTTAIQRHLDTTPTGWLGPGAAITENALCYLAEVGYSYNGDLQDDELPYFLHIENRTIVEIPYRKIGNINDFPIFTRVPTSPLDGLRLLQERFDAYREMASDTPMIFNYGTHPFVTGRPDFALVLQRFLEYVHSFDDVWVTNYSEVDKWWRQRHLDR